MSTEFEAQILDIDPIEFRKKVKGIGGRLIHKNTKLQRTVYSLCGDSSKGFVRVRLEGDGSTTMTSKIYTKSKDFPQEYEVGVQGTYDEAKSFLDSLQLPPRASQETYREKWSLPSVAGVREITIDLWPGLPPYAEIDCDTEETLKSVIVMFRIEESTIAYGPSAKKYEHYYGIDPDIINNHTPSLPFAGIMSEITPKKNKDLLMRVFQKYKKL
jgi:adenylate cyclase class IV